MGSDNVYGTLLNADVVSLVNGMVLRISANDRVVRAQADAAPNVQGLVGVNGSGTVGIGGPVNVVMAAVAQRVLCETGLTIAAGDTLYVSTVPGRATNVAPAIAIAIGSVEDVGSYVADSYVFAAINIPATTASAGGGAFPGYGGALAAVGIGTSGISGLAARGDHGHATLSQPTSAALVAMAVTDLADGTPCYVASRDGVFRLETSARTTNTWDTFDSATPGRQWLRVDVVSLKNAARTTWSIDTAAGSDDAAGTALAPLKTYSELAWRLAHAPLGASVVVTTAGNMAAADLPIFSFRCAPGFTFTITCTPVDIYASTIGVVTVAAAGPGTGDNNFTDPAVPGGSFTAAGAMAAGVIGTRAGTSYFWFALDKGATTVRISKPSAALANGQAYKAQALPTINVMRFAEQRYNACVIQLARITSGPWTEGSLRFERCWFNDSSSISLPNISYSNCAWDVSTANQNISQTATGRGALITTGGMVRGANALVITLGGLTSSISGSPTLQGAALIVQGGFTLISADIYANDCVGGDGPIQASYWGILLFAKAGATAGLVGSGNTNYLLYADRMSLIACVDNPLVAGSSPSATPVHATGSPDASVANFANGATVINRSGNGVYLTNQAGDAALVAVTGNAAPGVVAVTINNAPAGSPAAPARYAQVPDGAGGFYTFPSLT